MVQLFIFLFGFALGSLAVGCVWAVLFSYSGREWEEARLEFAENPGTFEIETDDKRYAFTWRGGRVVSIAHELLEKEPDLLKKLPWKLKYVGERYPFKESLYKRRSSL